MADRISRGHQALSWIHVVMHGFRVGFMTQMADASIVLTCLERNPGIATTSHRLESLYWEFPNIMGMEQAACRTTNHTPVHTIWFMRRCVDMTIGYAKHERCPNVAPLANGELQEVCRGFC